MQDTLLKVGLACIIAAIVGGGLKAFGVEVPLLKSWGRQFVLAAFGAVLIGASMLISERPAASEFLPSLAPHSEMAGSGTSDGGKSPKALDASERLRQFDENTLQIRHLEEEIGTLQDQIEKLDSSYADLRAQRTELQAMLDRGEGTAADRERAGALIAKFDTAEPKFRAQRIASTDAIEGAKARISILQQRNAALPPS